MEFNYNLFNPFFVTPIIIGVLSLFIQMGTGLAVQKGIATFIFGFSFLWSLIGIMGIAEPIQLLQYLPHIILVILHIVVWIVGRK